MITISKDNFYPTWHKVNVERNSNIVIDGIQWCETVCGTLGFEWSYNITKSVAIFQFKEKENATMFILKFVK